MTSALSSASNSSPNNMITLLLCVLSFVAGALVMRKHKAKADSIESKSKELLSALKGK